jgi:hypothetical protein
MEEKKTSLIRKDASELRSRGGIKLSRNTAPINSRSFRKKVLKLKKEKVVVKRSS